MNNTHKDHPKYRGIPWLCDVRTTKTYSIFPPHGYEFVEEIKIGGETRYLKDIFIVASGATADTFRIVHGIWIEYTAHNSMNLEDVFRDEKFMQKYLVPFLIPKEEVE